MKPSFKWVVLVAALASGLAVAEEPSNVVPDEGSGTCTGVVTDETEPALREFLARPDIEVYQIGETMTIRVSKEKQVSTANIGWTPRNPNAPGGNGKVECTLECSGQYCNGSGCQAGGNSCSGFSCSGTGCSGKCSQKTSTQ